MTRPGKAFQVPFLMALAVALGGCSTHHPRRPPAVSPVFFPPEPELPRIQYLTSFSGRSDIERQSAFNRFVVGERPELKIDKPYGVGMHDGKIYVCDTNSTIAVSGMVPGSVSLLCLSCHNGSVAVNSWGNAEQATRSTGSTTMIPGYRIGQDQYLGNHHPIGFEYEVAKDGDVEVRSADTMLTPTSTVADHLYNGRMECATCHSVHNKGNTGEKLLWRSDQNSELCLTCHDKGIYTAP